MISIFTCLKTSLFVTERLSAVGSKSNCRSKGCEFPPSLSHTFVDIDHEIISMVILLLPLIQEGLLSVTHESMCTKYWLTA